MTDYKKESATNSEEFDSIVARMMAENAELTKRCETLVAHMQRLRNLASYWIVRGRGIGTMGEQQYKAWHALGFGCNAWRELPSQSLRHIEHRVEEETLEHFCNYVAHELGLALTKDDVANYQRKYPKEVDNG